MKKLTPAEQKIWDAGFMRAIKLMTTGPKNKRFWDNREKRLAPQGRGEANGETCQLKADTDIAQSDGRRGVIPAFRSHSVCSTSTGTIPRVRRVRCW